MPTTTDLLVVALFSVGFLALEHLVVWPRARAAIDAGRPGARIALYCYVIVMQWLFVAIVALRLHEDATSWATLGLRAPGGWRLTVGAVLVVLTIALYLAQLRSIRRLTPERRAALGAKVRAAQGQVLVIIPATTRELRNFLPLAVTAGICEELLYRGFAVWVLSAWLGAWGAMLASALLFAAGHAYQGARSAVRSGIVGALLQGVVLLTGSLLPAIVLHAVVDVGGGLAAFWLLAPHRTAY